MNCHIESVAISSTYALGYSLTHSLRGASQLLHQRGELFLSYSFTHSLTYSFTDSLTHSLRGLLYFNIVESSDVGVTLVPLLP